MSNLSDAALPIAADVLDLINAAHTGDHHTLAHIARCAHLQHGTEALILLAHITAGLAQQHADTTGRSVDDIIAELRRRAAA